MKCVCNEYVFHELPVGYPVDADLDFFGTTADDLPVFNF